MIWLILCSQALAGGAVLEDARGVALDVATYGDDGPVDRRGAWWADIEDTGLQKVLQDGLPSNPDLRAAEARVDLARANTWMSLSALLPSIALEATTQEAPTDAMGLNPGAASIPNYGDAFASLGTLLADLAAATGADPSNVPDFSGAETSMPDTFRQSSAMLKGAWTVDVFGRQTMTTMASHKDARAARSAAHAQHQATTALLASAWYNVVAAREQSRVVEEQVQTAQSLLDIVQLRYERGEGSALDVLQQRQQLAGTKALLPRARAGQTAAEGLLSAAMGKQRPAALPASSGWPDLPSAPGLGHPRRLVDDRPDVQAAVRSAEATRLRHGAAYSALAPTLTLTGQYGRQYLTLDETESVDTWGVGAVATMPLFAGGRTHAGIRAARAAKQVAAMELQSTVLAAVQQVESAIAGETAASETLEAVKLQAAAARDALTESKAHYLQGLAPYVSVLAALAADQAAQLALLDAHRSRLDARINLHLALGGQWRVPQESSP